MSDEGYVEDLATIPDPDFFNKMAIAFEVCVYERRGIECGQWLYAVDLAKALADTMRTIEAARINREGAL